MHSEFGRSWRVFLKIRFNIDCTDRRYDTVSVNAQLLLFPKMNKSWCETGPFCRHYHFTWDVSLSCWRFIKWNLKFMQNLTFSQICSWILYLKSGKSWGVNIPACLFKVTEYNLLHLVCIFLAVKKNLCLKIIKHVEYVGRKQECIPDWLMYPEVLLDMCW